MIKTKSVSSLYKVFPTDSFSKFKFLSDMTVYYGQRVTWQVLYTKIKKDPGGRELLHVSVSGKLAPYVLINRVGLVPVDKPCNGEKMPDDNYLSDTPGLYPDVLLPLMAGEVSAHPGKTQSLMIFLNLKDINQEMISSGDYPVKIKFMVDRTVVSQAKLTIHLIPLALPKQTFKMTQWFYCDCLAQYYHVKVWSKEHWRIIENFARKAAESGITMLLMPVFTPPLDTKIGGERLTTQLVDVALHRGQWSFDFQKVDQWIEMCRRVGIEQYEVAHLYTQWGAEHAPKIIVQTDEGKKRLFGWDTDSTGPEYRAFLRAFLKAFLDHMKSIGEDKKCVFHISDEPSSDHLKKYREARENIADLLEGYTIMDALSDYDFYAQGVVKQPVVSTGALEPFLSNQVPDLWCYTCCGPDKDYSNRFIAMPGWRTRFLGVQMYLYHIIGYLNWGYNFYNTCYSTDTVNPFLDTCAGDWVPGGDPFSVYPACDGTPLESLRLLLVAEGLQDMRLLTLSEQLVGREETVKAVEEAFGGHITFATCPKSMEQMQAVLDAVNQLIARHLS